MVEADGRARIWPCGTSAAERPSSRIDTEKDGMSEISKTTKDGTEYRDDGSKVATEHDPSGETETEKVNREQSKLPNGGASPEYDEADESRVAAPAPRTGS
ncbi:hypothetical protein [Antarcticirhabdus aurantiaca]|uniref:Uncharacterized protein n=1 Tax=Antarcticirhabdus aurantiaca TaxID=2606717 RepID=A0ACD4NM18_9HYPH|nr:hypothetical protein [Antarcticirhabdus aurantiaca]WAJ27808.1 hypothetical protein OXU80_23675 [Jeongeuplla avenae]